MFFPVESFLGGLVLVLVSLYFLFSNYCFIGGWGVMGVISSSYDYMIYIDWESLMFMGIVFFISGLILVYSFWYVGDYYSRFINMMIIFVFSMIFLLISPNLLSMMLGWDGLGLVSFCLVFFYYGSSVSVDSSLITVLYNRLGDSMLLVSIGVGIYSIGGLMWGLVEWGVVLGVLVVMGLSTKSAQFPFCSWLPKAMSAPTPVSSLVHSSTLVTAGIYMVYRYGDLYLGSFILFWMSMLTVGLAGVGALVEVDLKKIIAYSTLSQMGFMMNGIYWGLGVGIYFHMIIHAVFKSMMFMCAGIFIHVFFSQDIRDYGGLFSLFPFSGGCMVGGVFSLCGLPFMSGFYSKDLVIEGIFGFWGMGLGGLLYYLCVMLTILYSARLIYYLFIYSVSFNSIYLSGEGYIGVPMIFLFLLSVILGGIVSGIIFMLVELFIVSVLIKSFVVFVFFFAWSLMLSGFYYYLDFKFKFVVVGIIMLDSLMFLFKGFIYLLSFISNLVDQYWLDYILGEGIMLWLGGHINKYGGYYSIYGLACFWWMSIMLLCFMGVSI